MNFIEFESLQKLRGGFYTHPDIAHFLTRWLAVIRPQRVLEPSCGDGIFLETLCQARVPGLRDVFACEIDEEESAKAQERADFGERVRLEIHTGDFLQWFLFQGSVAEPFDAVLGNPPFIRYQYLPPGQQFLAEKIFRRFSLPFTRHTNAWVPFVIASLAMLRPGGRLGMVVPSEIFHIPHAQSLRRYLGEHCSRILILDPEEIWFSDTLQGTVLLMAEKKLAANDNGHGVAVVPVRDRHVLSTNPEEYFRSATYCNGSTIEGKWMAVFLSARERALLEQSRDQKGVRRFIDIASVDVGIVTGANKFFLVPDSVVERFSLQKWAHPMFGRSDHVQGMVFCDRDYMDNRKAGLPANFLWFQEDDLEAFPPGVRRYLDDGVRQKLPTRFKCRTRTPWYKVPSVYTAPIAMLKRAHHYPRLVLNEAGAYTTDTAYRIRPLAGKAWSLVFGFVNSLTCLTAEVEGRHYGGGVLELVPSEIERLLVPVIKATRAELAASDRRYRSTKGGPSFLREQDAIILDRAGFGRKDQDTLHEAWLRLRDRRHRTPSTEQTEESDG